MREVLIIGVITAIGEVGLSISLVSVLGLAGAAISRVVISKAGRAAWLYIIRPRLKGAINSGLLAKAVVPGGVPGLVVSSLSSTLSNRVLILLPYTVLGLPLFFGRRRPRNYQTTRTGPPPVHPLPEKAPVDRPVPVACCAS